MDTVVTTEDMVEVVEEVDTGPVADMETGTMEVAGEEAVEADPVATVATLAGATEVVTMMTIKVNLGAEVVVAIRTETAETDTPEFPQT